MGTGITGKARHLPLRVPTPSSLKAVPALNERLVMFETKQLVIGNMLLSSCPGKKSTLLWWTLSFIYLCSPTLQSGSQGP